MAVIVPPRSRRQLGASPLWVPIGFRGFGVPGSGGVCDTSNTFINDLFAFQAPSFAGVEAVKLVYTGFDISNYGPVDRVQTVTGYAGVWAPSGSFTAYTAAAASAGASSLSLSLGAGLNGNAPSVGMLVGGNSGIPSGAYVSSVTPVYNAGTGSLTSYTVGLSAISGSPPQPAAASLTAGIAQTTAITFTGTVYPAKFGGRRQATIEPMHDTVVSDPIPVQIPASSWAFVHGAWTFSASNLVLASLPAPSSGSTTATVGGISEGSLRNTSPYDASLVPIRGGNSGAGFWPPAMILGLLATSVALPSVMIIGDSIAAGTGDAADGNGRMGYIARSLGNSVPWFSVARGSTSATQFQYAGRGPYRMAVEANVTDVFLEYCRNDINAGVSAATVRQILQVIAAPYVAAGMRVWVFTCPPTTSSSNSDWSTTANQTIPNSAYETQRLAYNADVRANFASYGFAGVIDIAAVVEDAGNPGRWKTNGGAWTSDGVHPNATGHAAAVAANLINPGLFPVT